MKKIAALLTTLALTACGGSEAPKSAAPAQPATTSSAPPAPAPAQVAAPAPDASGSWNMNDVNAMTNGNIPVAIALLKTTDVLKGDTKTSSADIAKAPFKYYGKAFCFSGLAGVVDEYPPGHEISQALGEQGGEVVLITDSGAIVDGILAGGTGKAQKGRNASICGYPVGRVEVTNGMGGQTTQLLIVGRVKQ